MVINGEVRYKTVDDGGWTETGQNHNYCKIDQDLARLTKIDQD
jgi:hypothetical protein